MAVTVTRKSSRIRSLWPSRDVKLPPAAPYVLDSAALQPIGPEARLPLRGLTASELIAMARAARARRPNG